MRNGTTVAVPRHIGQPDGLLPILGDPLLHHRVKPVRPESQALTLLDHSAVDVALCPKLRVPIQLRCYGRFRRLTRAPIADLTRPVHFLLGRRGAEPVLRAGINQTILDTAIQRAIAELKDSYAALAIRDFDVFSADTDDR